MATRFEDDGDAVILTGSKMWISNSPFADIALVWAKNREGEVHGLVVERGMQGFSTPETKNKWSLRTSATGELVFDNVRVPKGNILPGVKGMRGPLRSEEHTSELQSLMRISYAVFCLKKQKTHHIYHTSITTIKHTIMPNS